MSAVPFPPMKRPLVAILRGVKPEETQGIVGALIECGMTAIEIPLNSPDPFRSIETAVKMAPAGTLIGAGTVLTLEAVERLHDVGGRLLVSPNVDPEIIARAGQLGLVTMPGVFTATEALLAAKS
ncbi:MAG: 2-dehydro-3-deoxy-6-phosphogalactonate aldolase, partial [bacterium]|nr:2-dehydro-3-deoxy-6-phosphogalactonate aldolase [bacterium]